ncbi:MAG: hypothetical protein LBF77_10195 [Spirochaetaceae bacterium]|jgi:hypothetical protein|nr:hypothetical protein [Spirochaetaceae bacterium]
MWEISQEERQKKFSEIAAPYNEMIDKIIGKEKALLRNVSGNTEETARTRLKLAEEMFNLCSWYIVECKIFLRFFGRHNEDILNEARKALYKGIAYIEDTVSPWVDVPFSDYEDKVAMLSGVSGKKRYLVIRKMGLAADLLKDFFGDSSKWKWSFVVSEGRLAAAAKNLLDMKSMVVNLDPRSEEHEATVFHLRRVKKLLMQAAERYREKYELSSRNTEDFQQAINFLNALKRFHTLLNERSEAEEIRKTVEVWNNKLKDDLRRKKEGSVESREW